VHFCFKIVLDFRAQMPHESTIDNGMETNRMTDDGMKLLLNLLTYGEKEGRLIDALAADVATNGVDAATSMQMLDFLLDIVSKVKALQQSELGETYGRGG
jgi:hypothetical protein